MSRRSIYPLHATTSPTPSADWQAVFVITGNDELPRVNVARSVRSVWLHGNVEQAYVRFMNRWKLPLIGGYAIGLIAFWLVLVVPASIGAWIAIVGSILTTVMSGVYTMVLRYDVVCLIVRTYEFWFFSLCNVISAVLLAIHLGDWRASMAFSIWLTLQNNIFTDANTVFTKGYVATAIIVLLFLQFLIGTIAFDFIDGVQTVVLLQLDTKRRLLIQDALIHGYYTQAIMLARNIYRRWTTIAHLAHANARTVACVTLRARVQLQRIHTGAPVERDVVSRLHAVSSQSNDTAFVQLQLIPIKGHYPADQILVPAFIGLVFTINMHHRNVVRTVLLTVAYTGLSFTVLVSVFPSIPHTNTFRMTSFICSATFIGCSWTTAQRQLLRQLVFTFDFMFLSAQLIVVHACGCDMVGWGYPSLPIVTIWLWIQWVLTTDAVSPVLKAKWGIRRRLSSIIMLVFIVSQILVLAAIVSDDGAQLQNRVFVSVMIRGHLLEMKVIPMLMSRLVILFGWSWKVLWRMWIIRHDELLMIQGSMTYVTPRRHRKPQLSIVSAPSQGETMESHHAF